MEIERGRISSSQLLFLIAGSVQGSALTISFAITITKQNTWLVVLSASLLALSLIWMYVITAERFPGKNLIQINDLIYGRYLGKLVSSILLLWLLTKIPLHFRYIGDFFLSYFMPETPMLAIIIPFTFLCVWATRQGIEVIARTSFILVVITLIMIFLIIALLLKDIDLTNFLPFLDLTPKDFIQGSHMVLTISYSDELAFLMVIPYVIPLNKVKKSILTGFLLGAATLFIVAFLSLAVLGSTATILTSPFLEAARLINIAKVFTRLEMLVVIALLITLFLKVCVLLYAVALGMAQMFGLRSYRPIVYPIGVICTSLTILFYESVMEQFEMAPSNWPFLALPFMVLLPAFSLLIAKVRKLPKKKEGGF